MRDGIAAVATGPPVDLSHRACSTITLAAGDIGIPLVEPALRGPGQDKRAIVAGHGLHALRHHAASPDAPTIEDVTVANGDDLDDPLVTPGERIHRGGVVALSRGAVTAGVYSNGGGDDALGDVTRAVNTASGCTAPGNRSIGNAFQDDDTTQRDEPQPSGQGGLPFVRDANGQDDIGAIEAHDNSDTTFQDDCDG